MNKYIKIGNLFLCIILCIGLTSCKINRYKDGTYKAEYGYYNNNGWKSTLTVVIKNGLVESAIYDEISEADGSLKSESENYALNWIAFGYQITPKELYEELNTQLVQKQDIQSLEINASGEDTLDTFKYLFTSLEENMYNGIEETFLISQ